MNAAYEFNRRLAGHGLFYNQEDSKDIVTSGVFNPKVTANWYAIKYGGDWGGMWGNPDTWGKLSPKGGNRQSIVPFLYVTPENYRSYPEMVGGLLALEYPAVILDVEMEWVGSESILYSLLASLNLTDNLVPITGFAWFNGWPNNGQTFKKVVNQFNTVYLPQMYLSDWNNIEEGLAQIKKDMQTITLPIAPVFDEKAISISSLNEYVQCGLSLWCEEYTNDTDISAFLKIAIPNVPVPDPRTSKQRINDDLGQAIEYANQALEFRETIPVSLTNLITAFSDAAHNARKENGGE